MPKVRRQSLPPALLQHLLTRIQQRSISADQLGLLATWLDTDPEVSAGLWFKRVPGMIVCGEGEWVKIFLTTTQTPIGDEAPQALNQELLSHQHSSEIGLQIIANGRNRRHKGAVVPMTDHRDFSVYRVPFVSPKGEFHG